MLCSNCGIPLNPADPPWCDDTGCYDPICWAASPEEREERKTQQTTLVVAQAEYDRALGLNAAPNELAALQAANLATEGIKEGDPWRQPTGAHDAYPLGAVVSHEDDTWESTVAANVWEPGVSGWKTAGPGVPEWVAPTGAHDAYPKDAIVTHNGKYWKSNVAANVWEPPTQWTEIAEP